MNTNVENSFAPNATVTQPLRTVGETARELQRSTTTVKKLALETNAPVERTESGRWIFPPAAVERIRQEIARREVEKDRR